MAVTQSLTLERNHQLSAHTRALLNVQAPFHVMSTSHACRILATHPGHVWHHVAGGLMTHKHCNQGPALPLHPLMSFLLREWWMVHKTRYDNLEGEPAECRGMQAKVQQ